MLSFLNEVTDRQHLMLLPSGALALWSIGSIMLMGAGRFKAVSDRKVNPKYYKEYDSKHGAGEPHWLGMMNQNIENTFETPTLFHAAAAAFVVSKTATPVTLGVAWLYVGLRYLHTYIHVGSNHLARRFYAFVSSVLCLVFLWAQLMVNVSQK